MDVRISAVQGEAAGLDGVVGEDAADLVICHSVLEYVDSPADALAAIARVLRPGGTVSVLASGQVAAVLHRALTGRFDEARALLEERARLVRTVWSPVSWAGPLASATVFWVLRAPST